MGVIIARRETGALTRPARRRGVAGNGGESAVTASATLELPAQSLRDSKQAVSRASLPHDASGRAKHGPPAPPALADLRRNLQAWERPRLPRRRRWPRNGLAPGLPRQAP